MEPVVFSTDAADRIAKVVREAERAAGRRRFRERPPAAAQEKTWVVAGSIEDEEESIYNGVAWTFNGATLAWEEHGACYVVGQDQESLTNGSRYPVRRTGTYEGVPIFTVLGDAASGITAEGYDGSPVLGGTKRVRFKQDTGIDVEDDPDTGNPSTVIVSMLSASPSQVGVVTFSEQSFDGVKKFQDRVELTQNTGGFLRRSNGQDDYIDESIDLTQGSPILRRKHYRDEILWGEAFHGAFGSYPGGPPQYIEHRCIYTDGTGSDPNQQTYYEWLLTSGVASLTIDTYGFGNTITLVCHETDESSCGLFLNGTRIAPMDVIDGGTW